MRNDSSNEKSSLKSKKEVKAKSKHKKTAEGSGVATKKKKYKLNKKKFLLFILGIFLTIFLAVCVYSAVVIIQAPKIDANNVYETLSQSSVVYDINGKEVDNISSEENRTNVKYKDMPENLINSFVALEDKTFWSHHGFNFIRILGAIKDAIFSGGQVSGTSTITQQLARNIYLKEDMSKHSLKRKIVEAYYTVILEKDLSKEEIIEAYLNTINLGYGSYGVQAASQAYFSKDVKDLSLAQCTALAAIPQAPTSFALVELVGNDSVTPNSKDILKRSSNGTYIVNDASKERRLTCQKLMLEQNFISQTQYDKISNLSLRKILNPSFNSDSESASYFTDYLIKEVINDLMEDKGLTYDEAWDKVYKGGLKIYSTMDAEAQKIVEKEFSNSSNFPSAVNIKYDGSGNILDDYGNIVMYDYNDFFNSKGDFTFKSDEINKNDDGSFVIKSGKRLNIYDTTVDGKTDYSIEFKTLYIMENGRLFSISGGYINIPKEYKSKDDKGNVTISADFIKKYPDWFKFNSDGTATLSSNAFTLNQKVVQPQAAMTIVENSTGQIKAMIGGRETTGRMLYNRATSTRQPGSSIKPLAVYSAAIQQSAEECANGKKHTFTDYHIDSQGAKFWGSYLTAGSIVIDEKTVINGNTWPKNSGGGYSGSQTMRTALQQSINTCAVKIFMQVGAEYSADLVEKYGITSLVRDGSTNDINAAALALGGMTKGVTTLEMASAYTVFPNNGTRKETTVYTKILDSNGNEVLSKSEGKKSKVLDDDVAWIVTDMLKSVVTNGLGRPASISGVQAGGKTGTTSDQYDIWFDGFTPNYSASLWIGNDVNIQLSSMSNSAAALWGKIMNQISGAKKGSYKSAPSTVVRKNGEYYVSGTEIGTVSKAVLNEKAEICTESGYLATPDCPHTTTKTYDTYKDENPPKYYCNIHNKDVKKYPIDPKKELVVDEGESTEPDNGGGTGNGDNNSDENDDNTNPPNNGGSTQ